jgi:hypothetical protein
VPRLAASEKETRQGSSEHTVSQTPLWTVDFSINPELFRLRLGADNGRLDNARLHAQIGKPSTRPLSAQARGDRQPVVNICQTPATSLSTTHPLRGDELRAIGAWLKVRAKLKPPETPRTFFINETAQTVLSLSRHYLL